MLSNYLTIAFRNLWKNKLYAFINITGLAAGITCLLLAVLFTRDEHSFDSFHRQSNNLYRVTTSFIPEKGNKSITTGGTGQVQGPAFKAQISEIADYTRIMGGDISGDMIANGKVLKQQLLFADDHFFNVFSFKLIAGDTATALKDVGSAVITERTALKFFNTTDVVGKLLRMDEDPSARKLGRPLVITGVVSDPPQHSSIQFDVLLSFKFLQLSFEDNNWYNQYLGTFVLLQPGADTKVVAAKMDRVHAMQAGNQLLIQQHTTGFDQQVHYGLQPITEMHLAPLYQPGTGIETGVVNGSRPVFSYIFLGIAVFILIMAGINFVNIHIAGSMKRAREVGVRKINGSSSIQIIVQFMLESLLLCVLACVLAALLTVAVLPLFNQLSGKQLLLREALDAPLLLYCLLILGALVLLTGTYPASLLAKFKPVEVLYNKQRLSGGNILGRSLVVLQFSLAVCLLIASLVFYKQMDYVRTRDLGYNPHQVIRTFIGGDREAATVQAFLKNQLAGEPGVKALSFGGERGGASLVKLPGKSIEAVHRVIDEQYLPALSIPVKEGRNFAVTSPADKTGGAIVNEAFVKAAGLKDPIGTVVQTDPYFDKETRTIIGVVKDFHAGSLKERIAPMVLLMNNWYGKTIWIKFDKERQQQVLLALEKAYRQALPQTAFSWSFLDELNAKEYEQEQRWKRIISVATIISLLICCSGLFGLAHISTRQRFKEIGIRKVLGAGIPGIAALFSKDLLKPVLLALIIAVPAAWSVMQQWLQQFVYRIELSYSIFLWAAVLALSVAAFTVVSVVFTAARANPLDSLREQ